jgi:hypothetical protein
VKGSLLASVMLDGVVFEDQGYNGVSVLG